MKVDSEPYTLRKSITGMLAPLTGMEGNVQNSKEDWNEYISSYVSDYKKKYAPLLSSTTLWKVWAPSYEHYLGNKKYEILQLGYGDESNSVPIMIDKEILDAYEILYSKNRLNNLATPIETSGTLVSLKNEQIINFFNSEETSGIKLGDLSDRFSKIFFAGEKLNNDLFHTRVEDPKFFKKRKKEWYAAYIWAQLHIPGLEKNIVVWDHVNLADPDVMKDYVELLGMKIKYYANKYRVKNKYSHNKKSVTEDKGKVKLLNCSFKFMSDALKEYLIKNQVDINFL